jgi:putative transcriptional regulator
MEKIEKDIFNLSDKQPEPARGSLLVAKPVVMDNCFKRSVIMLVSHDKANGSMGVIINKFTGLSLKDVVPEIECDEDIPLYLGGPVQPEILFFMHTLGPEVIPNALQLNDELYFGGSFEAMKDYVNSGQPVSGCVKFILGYSGWDAMQLAGEIARHDWAVTSSVVTTTVMDEADDAIWQNVVKNFGDKYRLWLDWPKDVIYN